MPEFRAILNQLTLYCLQLVALGWLVAALWFAARRPGRVPAKLRHLVLTFFPEPWLVVLVPLGVLLVRLVPASAWAALSFWSPATALVGSVLVVLGTVMMLWARWTLGVMWAGRPIVQQEHELCTSGAYRLVRHPIYTGTVGLLLGSALVHGLGATTILLLLGLPFVAWRVWAEERMMVNTFGDRYRHYRRQVPALAPLPHRARRGLERS